MPVVFHAEKGRTLTTMRWGVWPFYEKTIPSRPVVNARDDALLVKNIWKHSARTKRCVAAADGFFEWTGPQGAKWEVSFTLPERRPFFFGAVWSHDPVGEDRGFAILTTKPNPIVAEIGHDRTPLILDAEGAKRWIGSEPLSDEQLMSFCQPYAGLRCAAICRRRRRKRESRSRISGRPASLTWASRFPGTAIFGHMIAAAREVAASPTFASPEVHTFPGGSMVWL